ncbi:hypothetical protein M378DRAFT_169770 [Amanita muscaria Koide BX008]|uniref:Uncharacterized protein n=1 Tax=Amanita muscaria (strain Koide BX008) TaxID=946122 RepID=A0A0C2SYA0_AMAMK|nr:hypothetical protein M378DRAFT_169770 [Amanita muscaria Koide BX008]
MSARDIQYYHQNPQQCGILASFIIHPRPTVLFSDEISTPVLAWLLRYSNFKLSFAIMAPSSRLLFPDSHIWYPSSHHLVFLPPCSMCHDIGVCTVSRKEMHDVALANISMVALLTPGYGV